jgi:membrane fusion protein, copper/silver efflux system
MNARPFGTRLGPAAVCGALATALAIAAAPLAVRAQPGVSQEEARLAPVKIPAQRRQLIGLTFATVEEKQLVDRIDTTGTVEPDEQREAYVQVRSAGWIRRVFADQTYQLVRKGEPLFTMYSPDIASAEKEYKLALATRRRLESSTVEDVAAGAAATAEAAADRLRLLGVPEREIARLGRSGAPHDTIEIDSPASGYITDRAALPNLYAEPSTRLFAVASLTDVWVYAAVFQNQLGEVKTGVPVTITVDSYPGRRFNGKVSYIWPALDSATRTARVRCELPNPGGALKLGMFVRVELAPVLGRGIVIPDTGVLQTGTHNIVFVDRGDGYLEPRDVELGPHAGTSFLVRSGLRGGERIVSSANFLVDSESQIQAAIGAYVPPPPGATGQSVAAPAGTIQVSTDPSPPHRGRNRVRIRVTDSFGRPVTGAEVTVVFYMSPMPEMGMAAMRATAAASDKGGGLYEAEVALESGGSWQLSVEASKSGQRVANFERSITVAGPM